MPETVPYWQDSERAGVAVYSERRDRRERLVDLRLIEAWGNLKGRLAPRRVSRGLFKAVLAAGEGLGDLTDAGIEAHASALRPRLARVGFTPALIARSFAVVREASRRRLGIEHRPVQVHGASLLLRGALLEMATGEGKTVTAMLAAATAALAGRSVHVITVNDYLAERDHDELGPVLHLLGLQTGLVLNGMQPEARREAYAAHVTYVSNKEVTFDYLRDRMALGPRRSRPRARLFEAFGEPDRASGSPGLILSGLDFAIVDEADSVLIDEARTPLILSSQGEEGEGAEDYHEALRLAADLRAGVEYELPRDGTPRLLPAGRRRVAAEAADLQGLWRVERARDERVRQALSALHRFSRDQHYIVAEEKVQIVDEFTGRVMPDRSWEAGLHQMIEAKEGVPLTGRRTTISRITYQRFFRRYLHLCGMTGTGLEVAGELEAVFGLATCPVPTHRPVRRRHLGTRLYRAAAQKRAAIIQATAAARARGQPVLIGVRTVDASEALSRDLDAAGIDHVVLNARQDAEEAAIVAKAGMAGAVTVATNMAGRGTDIKLGEGIAGKGGLHVILTEFHQSGRIDRQLYGRAGRQGDAGSCEAIVALDDELFLQQAPAFVRLMRSLPAWCLGFGMPALGRWLAQRRGERDALLIRRLTVKHQDDLDRQLAFAGRPD